MIEIRILVVEDDPLIAADIEQCLNNINFQVSAVVHTYDDALYQLQHNLPDAVLMDLNLEDETAGIDSGEVINNTYKLPFIYLSSHADRQTLERAKKTFPAGYIVKPFDERDLLANLEIALYNYALKNNVKQPHLSHAVINKHILKPLSEREFEILQAIYEGKTNQQMAEILFLSVNTIKTHIANIYLKLDVASRTAAIAKVRSWS